MGSSVPEEGLVVEAWRWEGYDGHPLEGLGYVNLCMRSRACVRHGVYMASNIALFRVRAAIDSNGRRNVAKTSASPWTPMPIGRWRSFEKRACWQRVEAGRSMLSCNENS